MIGRGALDLVRTAAKAAAPLIAVFALHLAVRGLAGAGFAAGAVLALVPVLYGLAFGVGPLAAAFPAPVMRAGLGLGLLAIAGCGLFGPAFGLRAFSPTPTPEAVAFVLQSALGLVAACGLTLAFTSFAARAPDLLKDDG